MNELFRELVNAETEGPAATGTELIPVASPMAPSQQLQPTPVNMARPYHQHGGLQQPYSQPSSLQHPYRPPTDRLAIASAICGFTAIIPIVSQVIGLGLGIASIIKIRRARREGLLLGGTGWAWTGILSSGFTLMGWILLFVAFLVLGTSLAQSTGSLQSVLEAVR